MRRREEGRGGGWKGMREEGEEGGRGGKEQGREEHVQAADRPHTFGFQAYPSEVSRQLLGDVCLPPSR